MDDDLGGIAGGSRRDKTFGGDAGSGKNIAVSKEAEERGTVGDGEVGSGAKICVDTESVV